MRLPGHNESQLAADLEGSASENATTTTTTTRREFNATGLAGALEGQTKTRRRDSNQISPNQSSSSSPSAIRKEDSWQEINPVCKVMALFFSEQEIDGFRDCFYLNCKSGVINDVDQLKFVMRSVGFSPTIDELKAYLKQRNGSMKFADFLDCAHAHRQIERIPEEILKAFQVSPLVKDHQKISLDVLRHLLCSWGEKFSHREFNALIKEMNLNRPEVSYNQFVKMLAIPRSES